MDQFLKSYFPSLKNLSKKKLPGDGGHRDYIRVKAGRESFILMSCGKKDPSLKKFIEVQKKTAGLVHVPKIFHKDLKRGFLLLEDLGDQNLERTFFQKGIDFALPFYHQALIQLIKWQSQIKKIKTEPLFDQKFFLKETEIAWQNLQTYIQNSKKAGLGDKLKNFKKDMAKVVSDFKPEDYVYCHRDYHSRNLMLKKGQVFLIDFQDAGQGPWYYDLTSLLYDSYVPLSPDVKNKLAQFYFENLSPALKKRAQSLSHAEFMMKRQFLQRGFKACGCFAAFKNLNQKSSHLKYIQPTLKLLQSTAKELSYSGIYKYIGQMTEILES